MKKYVVLLAAVVFGFNVEAQQVPAHCGIDEYGQEMLDQNPELKEIFEQRRANLLQIAEANAEAASKKGTQSAVLTIPVVFHVVYATPNDNISKSQIMDGLRILNEDFNLQNPDASNVRAIFQSRQANVEVKFELAKKDPSGNCSDGINRIQSSLSVDANPRDQVKTLVQWDPAKYLNIWVVRSIINDGSSSGIILGYANFPWWAANKDGIVIRHDALGVIGTATFDGRTLTHEVGHYLGLLHTFQGGCNGGDNISDTPPVASASYGCNLNKNSCNNDSPDYPDMVENFMDYADGACQNTFTNLQKNMMRSVLTSAQYRSVLVSNANLLATGIINPPACAMTPDFELQNQVICKGDTLQFLDQTEDGDPDTYSWSFQGGVPSTSADANPKVYYPVAGAYNATLTVTNAAGTNTITKQHIVQVKPIYTNNMAEWREDFEAPTISSPELSILTRDNIGFELTNQAAKSGIQSLFLDNFNAPAQEVDALISPTIHTQFGKNLMMSFDYAFARKANTNNDALHIYASVDCGKTWTIRRVISAVLLNTASSTVTTPFTPTVSEWKTVTVGFDIFANSGPILIKFEFISGGGNNLYIDNINFAADNIGLEEEPLSKSLSVYPNPSNGQLNISLNHSLKNDLSMVIYDLYGKQVASYSLDKETINYNIENLNLASGIYVLSFTDGEDSYSQKLVVE